MTFPFPLFLPHITLFPARQTVSWRKTICVATQHDFSPDEFFYQQVLLSHAEWLQGIQLYYSETRIVRAGGCPVVVI